MKIHIEKDERWPDYFISELAGIEVDVPEDTVQRWEAAIKAYELVQDEMERAIVGDWA